MKFKTIPVFLADEQDFIYNTNGFGISHQAQVILQIKGGSTFMASFLVFQSEEQQS